MPSHTKKEQKKNTKKKFFVSSKTGGKEVSKGEFQQIRAASGSKKGSGGQVVSEKSRALAEGKEPPKEKGQAEQAVEGIERAGEGFALEERSPEAGLLSGGVTPVTSDDILSLATLGVGAAGAGVAAAGIKVGAGAIAKTGGRVSLTRTAETIGKFGRSATTQRGFIGRPGVSNVNKLFNFKTKDIAGRFATNSKTKVQTRTYLEKLGATIRSPAVLVGALGSYPFAGFIKEEALQTLGFATKSAIDNGDIEGAEAAFAQQEEALNPELWGGILETIPYANVLTQLRNFYKAAVTKLEVDRETLDLLQEKEGETLFQARQRAQSEVQGGN